MDNTDFEIELQEDSVCAPESIQLPMNILSFGQIESDDLKVYIKQDVYKALEKLSASDTSKELGSILIGDYCQELGKTHVIISGYIEAKYTDASAATLTFTHETWDYIHREQEKQFPGERIIGWQHTHPSYGIFLSNYDLFIQENFFNMPFQIAYVIDPVQNLRGFFQWKNGKVEKLKGYYLYDEVGKPIKVEQKKLSEPKKTTAKAAPKWVGPVVTLLALIIAALVIWCFALNARFTAQQQEQAQQYALLQDQLEAQNRQLEAMQSSEPAPDSSTETDALRQQVTQLEEKLAICQNALSELAGLVGLKDPLSGEALYVEHTVAPGESLSLICQQYGVDYQANKQLILLINHLTDPDQLSVGQILRIPLN